MRRTWDMITNEIIAQRRIELAAMRRRHKLEAERRQLELAIQLRKPDA